MKLNLNKISLFVFFAIFIFPSTTLAGACSGHGGVDCSAGHDIDGSVICEDGWTESSVQYLDIKDVCLEDYKEIGPFIDVTQSDPNREAILFLYKEGIIGGYPDGTFKPDKEINRAELLKVLIEGKGITPHKDNYNDCFPDVTEGWYEPYVCYAKESNWIKGYSDGTFKPSQIVNKVEAIKILLNSQDIELSESFGKDYFEDVSSDHWFYSIIYTAKEIGILEENNNNFYPGSDMKRGGFSENLYRLLNL